MRARLILVTGLLGLILYTASCDSAGYKGEHEIGTEGRVHSWPVWHPTGKTIAFMHHGITSVDLDRCTYSRDSTQQGLWLIHADGSQARQVFQATHTFMDWSADGAWITFEIGGQIYKADATSDFIDITTIEQLTTKEGNGFPQWSPDGTWIAYHANTNSPHGTYSIWKMKADGTEKQRLGDSLDGIDLAHPDWSPDGTQIVHVRHIPLTLNSAVFIMDADGQNPVQLTAYLPSTSSARFSPDGQQIVYESDQEVWLMDASGENQRQLTFNTTGGSRYPSWSPDGQQIVYAGPKNTLWTMDLEGNPIKQLTSLPQIEREY